MFTQVKIIGIAGSSYDFLLAPYLLKTYAYQFEEIKKKFQIEINNYHIGTSPQEILDNISRNIPSLLGFSCYIWNIELVKYLIKKFKGYTKIILGGPEISNDNKYDADYLVIGEGEQKFSTLLLENKLYNNQEQISDSDFKNMPSPYLSNAIPNYLLKPPYRTNFETQRGCNFRCAYCLYHRNFPYIKYRNPDNVVKEMTHVYEHGGKIGKILDANLFSNRKHPKQIFSGLIKNKVKMKLSIDSIPNFIDKEIADLCKYYINQGGQLLLGIGLQSLNPESMKIMKRSINLNSLDNALKLLSTTGIVIRIDTILGLPRETKDTYYDLLNYVIEKMKLNDNYYLGTYVLKILPGTEMVKIAEDEKLVINDNWHNVYSTPTMPRNDILKCLRLTAIAFRFFNSDNIDKKDKLSSLFFNKRSKLKISNIEFLELLESKFYNHLQPSSNFVQHNFPDAENYYFKQLKLDLPDNILIKIVEKL